MTSRMSRAQKLLRHELLRQRSLVMTQERREREIVRESAEAEHGPGLDEADLSATDLQADVDLAVLQMRSETMRHIDRALTRIDAGTFGVCEDCGSRVPKARLRALPFADRCRLCEEHDESTRTPPETLGLYRLARRPFMSHGDLRG